jgi:hypothetical protein
MARRYSQIKRGAEYEVGLNNYIDYLRLAETRPTKRMQGGVRGARRQTIPAAVRPFGVDLGATALAAVRVGTESHQELGAAVTAGRLATEGATLATAQRIEGFRPARVSAFRGSGAAAYVQSKVTKLYYLKYTGDSFSLPFGATAGAEEEHAGGTAVKAAILSAFGAADVKRVSISPEKVPV